MTNGQRILNRLSKRFYKMCGFDISDNTASDKKEAVEKAKKHIRWFRQWAEEQAQEMEREIQEVRGY